MPQTVSNCVKSSIVYWCYFWILCVSGQKSPDFQNIISLWQVLWSYLLFIRELNTFFITGRNVGIIITQVAILRFYTLRGDLFVGLFWNLPQWRGPKLPSLMPNFTLIDPYLGIFGPERHKKSQKLQTFLPTGPIPLLSVKFMQFLQLFLLYKC